MVLDDSKRTANFHTTLVVAAPGRDSLVVDADWKGYIGREDVYKRQGELIPKKIIMIGILYIVAAICLRCSSGTC